MSIQTTDVKGVVKPHPPAGRAGEYDSKSYSKALKTIKK